MVAGQAVGCNGECPCPDLITALQSGSGGLLLVPTDDSLLAAVDQLNATDLDWLSDTALLQQLLARHVILTASQTVSTDGSTAGMLTGCSPCAPAGHASARVAWARLPDGSAGSHTTPLPCSTHPCLIAPPCHVPAGHGLPAAAQPGGHPGGDRGS